MHTMTLTLIEAIRIGRLHDFIAQEECAGRHANQRQFERLIQTALQLPRSPNETPPPKAREGSNGK